MVASSKPDKFSQAFLYPPKVVNIMDALKKSMQAKGQTKVRDAVRKRMGKEPASEKLARASKSAKPTTGARRSVH
jgi:non-homologous end joining protein Ku